MRDLHDHHQVIQPVPSPASKPRYLPIAEAGAERPVTTSNGGGSPRQVPGLIEPEVHSPAGIGNALYVFALPDRR